MTQAQQDLGSTRDRLRDLSQRFPQLDAGVRQAAEEVENAKLEADLRPNDRNARELANHAARKLDAAILERDNLAESIERLRRHEVALSATVSAETGKDTAEAKAVFRVALAAEIKAQTPSARRWAALIQLDSELVGRQVGDPGRLMEEYLSGEYRHSALSSDRSGIQAVGALVASLRERYERGEVLS